MTCNPRISIADHTFQLTRSRGAWPRWEYLPTLPCGHFNSHAHVERDKRFPKCCWTDLHFNSHAHVERDRINLLKIDYFVISTHTLTWSVTAVYLYDEWILCISTHTLTWSVTTFLVTRNENIGFQLTRSRGAWLSHRHMWRSRLQFQLTRSRGAWQDVVRAAKLFRVFQLTRSRGAWRQWKTIYSKYVTFQLTRSRGAWRYHWNSLHRTCRFQLTRSRGAWLETSSFYDGENKNFNSHAHVERDLVKITFTELVSNFNSHAHVERDLLRCVRYCQPT